MSKARSFTLVFVIYFAVVSTIVANDEGLSFNTNKSVVVSASVTSDIEDKTKSNRGGSGGKR
jgi:hypothetical protein